MGDFKISARSPDLSWTNTSTEEKMLADFKMTLTCNIPAYGGLTFCLVHSHGPIEKRLALPIPKSRFTCDRPIVSNDVQATERITWEHYCSTFVTMPMIQPRPLGGSWVPSSVVPRIFQSEMGRKA